MRCRSFSLLILLLFPLAPAACGDDGADARGVGAECTASDECAEEAQECLTEFAGGYCGLAGCASDLDCPEGSACIAHDNGTKYCFLVCVDKVDCNRFRSTENESNCSSNIVFTDGAMGRKACVPPSSGL